MTHRTNNPKDGMPYKTTCPINQHASKWRLTQKWRWPKKLRPSQKWRPPQKWKPLQKWRWPKKWMKKTPKIKTISKIKITVFFCGISYPSKGFHLKSGICGFAHIFLLQLFHCICHIVFYWKVMVIMMSKSLHVLPPQVGLWLVQTVNLTLLRRSMR